MKSFFALVRRLAAFDLFIYILCTHVLCVSPPTYPSVCVSTYRHTYKGLFTISIFHIQLVTTHHCLCCTFLFIFYVCKIANAFLCVTFPACLSINEAHRALTAYGTALDGVRIFSATLLVFAPPFDRRNVLIRWTFVLSRTVLNRCYTLLVKPERVRFCGLFGYIFMLRR